MVITYVPDPNKADGKPVYFGSEGGGTVQVITSSDADPNAAGILPADQTKGAIFQQDPSLTRYNTWKWSVIDLTWLQTEMP